MTFVIDINTVELLATSTVGLEASTVATSFFTQTTAIAAAALSLCVDLVFFATNLGSLFGNAIGGEAAGVVRARAKQLEREIYT